MRSHVKGAYVEMNLPALATLQAIHFNSVAVLADCEVEICDLGSHVESDLRQALRDLGLEGSIRIERKPA